MYTSITLFTKYLHIQRHSLYINNSLKTICSLLHNTLITHIWHIVHSTPVYCSPYISAYIAHHICIFLTISIYYRTSKRQHEHNEHMSVEREDRNAPQHQQAPTKARKQPRRTKRKYPTRKTTKKATSTTQVQPTSSTQETSQSNDQALSLIHTNSLTRLLCHRMVPDDLLN